ncbi:capsule biosynthesis GfcC family protein [Pseudomonas sp. R37(2017)]|uniref:capsule biosynthesis GfcC family protein n=1 Tax=Pseudomonas sp. R37(2017) TaxID=1981685 RepID=UPI000A1ED778|nr:capsule biosynthesis GfcC family protein [Pseudomonas sp. R37(2017)]
MKRLNIVFAGLLLAGSGFSQADVTVSGDVRTPGQFKIQPGARLLDVITAARPDAQSYWLAAAWLRKPLLEEQRRLKVGILFDLKVLQRGALLFDRPARAALAEQLYEAVSRLPVTGRQIAVLDPVAVEVGFALNGRLDDGDRLVYPLRPDTVEVLGAVAQPCRLPYRAMQEARDYVHACQPSPEAEKDYLWVIQPDGQTRRVGIAMWNREEGHWPAAGSKILVPIKNDDLDPPTPELNQQLAEFLATQPVAEVAP